MIPSLRLDANSDLTARLNALPGALSTSILLGALKDGAEPMRSHMANAAPRADREIRRPDRADGHLADHISISSTRKVDGETLGEGQAAVAVGPSKDHWWGQFSEFGTFHESARPFARPAFDSTGDACLSLITDEIWARLRAAAERGFGASAAPFSPGTSGGGLL